MPLFILLGSKFYSHWLTFEVFTSTLPFIDQNGNLNFQFYYLGLSLNLKNPLLDLSIHFNYRRLDHLVLKILYQVEKLESF